MPNSDSRPSAKPMTEITIRGFTYAFPAGQVEMAVSTFDVWRDGLGKLSKELGRAAFLAATRDIAARTIRAFPRDDSYRTSEEREWEITRLTRALRATLARRPRGTGGGRETSQEEHPLGC